jgi:hypothetical protein
MPNGNRAGAGGLANGSRDGVLGLALEALEALDLPLVPGSKARKAPGLVFLTSLARAAGTMAAKATRS